MVIRVILFVLATHGVFIADWLAQQGFNYFGIIAGVIILYYNFRPKKRNKKVTPRLDIMDGGRRLLLICLYSEFIQIILYSYVLRRFGFASFKNVVFTVDFVIMLVVTYITWLNAVIRILCTSKWLSIIKRLLCIAFMNIPIINLWVMYYMCKQAYHEYEYNEYKIAYQNIIIEGDECATKYPIVLIHGVGFRDVRFFNYWGRIPKELTRLGAKIYYGNQEGWGTIEYNAQRLREKIQEIIKETNCGKVNIIAHSKGGLDSRYMITKLGMADCVASLTTMSTPHRGVRMVDKLIHLPKFIFKAVTDFVNRVFYKYGDRNPDFDSVVHSFGTKACERFNAEVVDMPQVYYQSYSAKMKNFFSDYILCIPYQFIKIIGDGDNDGLVSIESAKWGDYKGVLENKYRRGVSHGDVIDLKREDYRGFDVIQKYVDIVSELKQKGF